MLMETINTLALLHRLQYFTLHTLHIRTPTKVKAMVMVAIYMVILTQ